jgi:hypothetical protein
MMHDVHPHFDGKPHWFFFPATVTHNKKMLPQWGGGLTLDDVEKTQGMRWGKEDTLPPVGGFGSQVGVQHTNPFSNDFVANRAPGIRESTWDPTRLYIVPPSFNSTGNPVRNSSTVDSSHNSSWLTTNTMTRRQHAWYKVLLQNNQQDFPFNDWGTFSVPDTGIDFAKLKPYTNGTKMI